MSNACIISLLQDLLIADQVDISISVYPRQSLTTSKSLETVSTWGTDRMTRREPNKERTTSFDSSF